MKNRIVERRLTEEERNKAIFGRLKVGEKRCFFCNKKNITMVEGSDKDEGKVSYCIHCDSIYLFKTDDEGEVTIKYLSSKDIYEVSKFATQDEDKVVNFIPDD